MAYCESRTFGRIISSKYTGTFSSSVVCDALAVEARKRARTECFSIFIVKYWSAECAYEVFVTKMCKMQCCQ